MLLVREAGRTAAYKRRPESRLGIRPIGFLVFDEVARLYVNGVQFTA